jgi:RNA polymerase sigma factor (sigma-70 family)
MSFECTDASRDCWQESVSQERNRPMSSPQEEFLAFTQPYRGVIMSAIRRVCGAAAHDLLSDVEQDVYLALWQRWTEGLRIDYPVSYLYKVALRTALKVMRASRAPDTGGRITQRCPSAVPGFAAEALSAAERACLLAELLEHLPPEQARAVRAHLAGFSHTETAALYGWSAAVARHRIYRGVQALQTLMMQESR